MHSDLLNWSQGLSGMNQNDFQPSRLPWFMLSGAFDGLRHHLAPYKVTQEDGLDLLLSLAANPAKNGFNQVSGVIGAALVRGGLNWSKYHAAVTAHKGVDKHAASWALVPILALAAQTGNDPVPVTPYYESLVKSVWAGYRKEGLFWAEPTLTRLMIDEPKEGYPPIQAGTLKLILESLEKAR